MAKSQEVDQVVSSNQGQIAGRNVVNNISIMVNRCGVVAHHQVQYLQQRLHDALMQVRAAESLARNWMLAYVAQGCCWFAYLFYLHH